MASVELSELKSRCQELVDQVARTGEPLVITRRGKPIARVEAAERKELFGLHRGSGRITGDIVGPVEGVWEERR